MRNLVLHALALPLLILACTPGGRRAEQRDCFCEGALVEGGDEVHYECGEQFCYSGAMYECGEDGHATRVADTCAAPDCDADPNAEGCPCGGSDDEPIDCWSGWADATPGVGPCRSGQQLCVDGRLGPCVGQVLPTAELCDDEDNDCDGTADDGVRNEAGLCQDGSLCEERSRWIYVVTNDDELIRFEPDSMQLSLIGPVSCPAANGAHPFSMAVDRQGFAWVLYIDQFGAEPGRLYRVSVADASCEPTDYVPGQDGFARFGMGFVSDAPGSEEETLFIAGGLDLLVEQRLGRIEMDDLALSPIGSLPGSPELTGNGDAELWGFFPDLQPATVSRIDPDTANLSSTYTLDDVHPGAPTAWAFAFWGGRFYVFLETTNDQSSAIYRLSPDSGEVDVVDGGTGYHIVGAGVSTCAPVDLI